MLAHEKELYTYDEYLKISESDRCEFIHGSIFMMGSPSIEHQNVVGNLFFILKNYFKDKDCKPFIAPLDVTLVDSSNNKNVVQPDVFVICDKENIIDNSYKGIPTLIIEVVSPSNSSHDYITKLDLYLRAGVEEYWIINPANRNAICYRFINNTILKVDGYSYEETINSEVFKGLSIALKDVFE